VFNQATKISGEPWSSCAHCTMTLTVAVSVKRGTSCSPRTRNYWQSNQLPPTHAALEKHLRRATYQAYIWKHALEARIPHQQPDGEGWRLRGELEIDWTDLAPAPESVCVLWLKAKYETRRCSCVKNELHCTNAGACGDDCVNCDSSQELVDEDDDSSSSEEEDDDM